MTEATDTSRGRSSSRPASIRESSSRSFTSCSIDRPARWIVPDCSRAAPSGKVAANCSLMPRMASEILTRRVQHFTRGLILGSRAFIDGWFEKNREFVKGSSRKDRKRGSRSLGKRALRGLYALRDPRS